MITSKKQSEAVQARRQAAGKKGIANAVKRFNKWSAKNNKAVERPKEKLKKKK